MRLLEEIKNLQNAKVSLSACRELSFEVEKIHFLSNASLTNLRGQPLLDAEHTAREELSVAIYRYLADTDKDIINYAINQINSKLNKAKALLNDN